ncbi:helix-turn-helix domain-containing protein [Streptomyces sp. NPDC088387]|uniref:helix-turn-helix domain-containing protein n=1 Tax=Streptomyces sp. NPDC088387 TaxID=3365859 RepID=UPI003809EA54
MTEFDAIDALLAAAGPEVALPPAGERRALREGLHLSRTQVAQALGVSLSTVGGWESGRDPSGEVREKYAYFLAGAQAKLSDPADRADDSPADADADADAADTDADADADTDTDVRVEMEAGDSGESSLSVPPSTGDDDVDVLSAPEPCVLCGQPARHQVAGFPQHLDPAECHAAEPRQPAEPAPDRVPSSAPGGRARKDPARGGAGIVPVGRRLRTADEPNLIDRAVEAALAQHEGDTEAATATLVKRAIPDAMALLDHCRKGGRYDIVAHPWLPDILRKQTARGADAIWEARPKWTRPEVPHGEHRVTALDINGAYLSALKTHLPIGQLEHSTGGAHDRRRAGVHLITPSDWAHDAQLPHPIGNRDEPGPVWVTEPTLRLLLRLAGPGYGLCDPPEIHESWTSGATESLLEKFRIELKDARDRAITEDDEVTLEYVKAMYSKFVSTLGESNYNRELYRADWMHIIRSQAFVNLWWKAHRAYDQGLTVVRAMGTDELHVIGDWRAVFPEGRGVTEVKVKDMYTLDTRGEE